MTLLKILAGLVLFNTQGDTTKYYLYEKEEVSFYSTTYEFSYPQIQNGSGTTTPVQNYTDYDTASENEDTVMVSYKIPERLQDLLEIERIPKDMIDGYRVQIYAGASLDRADAIRGEFMDIFPQYGSYRRYIRPTFRVRVGDFNSRKVASNFSNEIRKFFPGAFVVPERIPSPKVRKTPTVIPVEHKMEQKEEMNTSGSGINNR